MEQPKKDEYWRVEYGALVKTEIIVQILCDNPEFGAINWYKDDFYCSHNGEPVMIKGELFKERFAEADEPLKGFM